MSTESHERFLDTNGLRFRALEWEGREPAALFVHATSFCADGWRLVIETLRAGDGLPRRCVAFDQRGHGRSDAPADPAAYQWTRLADDASALASVVAQGGAPILGVGHSSGATALLAAAGQHPERFAALVAVEPVLFERPDGSGADSFAGSSFLASSARRRRDRFASIADARERLRSKPPFANFDDAAFDALLRGMLASDGDGVALHCSGEREAWCYDGAVALDPWPLIAQIRVPLLLVLGEHSAVAPALRDRLVAATPSAQIATIPGGTHFTALERPREVGAAIARFLAAVA
jgi:pimeloyl-ACP methyl ester carboxylesterase